jgi:hypothetical protein
MDYIIVFVLGMIAATVLIRWAARRTIERIISDLDKEIKQTASEAQINVDLEVEQNIYFLYNSDDGAFMAQGKDVTELFQHVKQRFPDQTIKIVKAEPEVMQQLRDQLKELDENSNSVRSPS